MNRQIEKASLLRKVINYILNLRDPSPYWRGQATAWGIVLVVLVLGGVLFAVLTLSSVFGGGTITYEGKGAPGPVTFSHYSHMWFKDGKYKDCKTCHEQPFAAQKYGTFALRALRDSPPKKYRIGKDSSTLFVVDSAQASEAAIITYETPRACATCATGNCHDGKESFSRFQCLECHKTK